MSASDTLERRVIGLAMKVHSVLGPGFLELVNQNALVMELRRAGLEVEVGRRITVLYEGEVVGEFAADLIVRDPVTAEELLIEIKAVSVLVRTHSVQLVNYLSATGIDCGLLLNFGAQSLEFKTKARLYRRPEPPPDLLT